MSEPIHLVRHGEAGNPEGLVYADLDGFGLSERGRAQAAAAADRLPSTLTILSSPLDRAMQTADIIASATGAFVKTDDDLTEWRLGRRWAGEPWDALDRRFPGELTAYLDHPDRLPFAEESLAALADRVAGSVLRHREETAGPLVIVSHQDPIQAARLILTGRPLSELHLDKPGHGSVVTLVEDGNGAWRSAP